MLVYNICLFLIDNNIIVEGYIEWRDWLVRWFFEWENFSFSEIYFLEYWFSEVYKVIFDYFDFVVILYGFWIFFNIFLELVLGCIKRIYLFIEFVYEVIIYMMLFIVVSVMFL